MDFKETLEYIGQSNKYGSALGLDNIRELLARTGNPQRELSVVHVAGTNGKGSVVAFLDSILRRAGYKVGMYVSPAVDNCREIIRVDGRMISEEDMAALFTKIREAADKMQEESVNCERGYSHPTRYEMETAAAFMHFSNSGCDIVLLETGMGGDGDATNVMDKVVCSVLTSISMDHMQFLGSTVDKIAECKAGIIKEGCPVVLGIQDEEFENDVVNVVEKAAAEKNSELIRCKRPGSKFNLGVLGTFQQYNAACAAEVVNVLRGAGYNISGGDVESGLGNMRWSGRFEIICDNPRIIIDGAHNPGAAKTLADSVEMYFTNEPIVFIMGVLADKDYEGIAARTARLADMIYTVTPDNPRALDGGALAEAVRRYNKNTEFEPDTALAVDKAVNTLSLINKDKRGFGGAVIVFGSLSYLGDIRNIVDKKYGR